VAVGNVGVVGYSPRFTRRPGWWLFFDQLFLRGVLRDLSTGLLACAAFQKPVACLWISLWLNSGKNAVGGVVTGFWLSMSC